MKLVRDYEGERRELDKLEGKAYREALFSNVASKLSSLAEAKNLDEKCEALSDLQELYSTLVSAVMPKNPAAYDKLSKLAQKKGVEGGGYFKGYYE